MRSKNFAHKIWRKFPDRVRTPVDIMRRCARWKAAGVIFVHVPKAAGVSVSRAIYGRPLGHFFAKDIRRVCPETYASLPVFGVVRHPIDRLYSAYRFSISGGTRDMRVENPEVYQSDSFTSFEKFVCEWLPKQNFNEVDVVFKPQHFYLCDGDKIIVNKVIKLEHLIEGMRELSTLIGQEIVLGHHNKSPELPIEIASAETLSVIKQIYKQDFDLFSYSLEKYR